MRGTRGGFGRWERKPLDAVADFCLGKMLDQKKNKGDLLPYLANVNVRWGEFDLKDLREMRFEHHELDRFGLKYGDIVMCEGGEPGRCAIWKEQMPGMMFQKALHRIRPRECLNKEFLFYLFLHRGRTGHFAPLFTGATIKHLPREKLAKVEVAVPPIPVQERIASILSAYDDLIENNRRRIQLLDQAARLLYKEWFVHLRFPGHEHVAITNGVPEGWKKEKVCTHVDFVRGVEPGSKNYMQEPDERLVPFLRVGDFGKRTSDILIDASFAKGNMLKPEDVAITMDGTPGLVGLGMTGAFSSGIRKVVPKDNCGIGWSFIYTLLKSESIQATVAKFAKGTTILHASSSIDHMVFFQPPQGTLVAFESIVAPLLRQVLLLARQNRKLIKSRDLLLPQLMREGELSIIS